MANLDELRERYRKDPARSAFEDTAYELVDVNGMAPDAQLEVLAETAREMGWSPDCQVACRHGSFVIREGDMDYVLPFSKGEDNRAKIVVPECTPEVAARIEAPAYIAPSGITSQTADTTIDLSGVWDIAGTSGLVGKRLREAIVEAAGNSGWPDTTNVTTDSDIFRDNWKINLSDGRGHVVEMELEPGDSTLTVGKYDPGKTAIVANPPAPGAGAAPAAFIPTKTRTRKLLFDGITKDFDEPLDDDRKVLLAVRAMLPAAGWPAGETRVSVELDDEDVEVYVVRCGDVSAEVEVKHKWFRDTIDGTTVTLPSFASAGVK